MDGYPLRPRVPWRKFVTGDNGHLASPEAFDLLDRLLQYDHHERLTCQEALQVGVCVGGGRLCACWPGALGGSRPRAVSFVAPCVCVEGHRPQKWKRKGSGVNGQGTIWCLALPRSRIHGPPPPSPPPPPRPSQHGYFDPVREGLPGFKPLPEPMVTMLAQLEARRRQQQQQQAGAAGGSGGGADGGEAGPSGSGGGGGGGSGGGGGGAGPAGPGRQQLVQAGAGIQEEAEAEEGPPLGLRGPPAATRSAKETAVLA